MLVRSWIWPLVLVSAVVFILSLRQLSDPDLGFHLKYGEWILANQSIPETDQSTYTVSGHPYIDLHWLFQVILFKVFNLSGYRGISIFFWFLSLLLFLLLLLRHRAREVPTSIISIAMLAGFLIIDPRIAPRPEMFTFLFLTVTLLILDQYFERQKNMLFLLPAIMLIWCNMHALFILGLIVIAVYFISLLVKNGKIDKPLLLWMIISIAACFINPYGAKAFILPIELLTRFDSNNIYNQHIQEFIPFYAQKRFVIPDYLFMMLLVISAVSTILTFRKQKLHEIILPIIFGFLAITSIRNISLFVIIALPLVSQQVSELSGKIRFWRSSMSNALYAAMIILPMALIPRLITNAYYLTNNSFNKTGMGVNLSHQPNLVATFLLENNLNGRILNSIGFGGWLSWTLPQPVFIDGRLEVMQESIYKEVTKSWQGGLSELIDKYNPELIVYNYLKYYPWTIQLKQMSGWRLIYVDGIAAVFARRDYAKEIPETDLETLPSTTPIETHRNLNDWVQGFYRPTNYAAIDLLHLSMFRFQMNSPALKAKKMTMAVAFYNSANQRSAHGDYYGALADYDSAIMLQPAYCKAYNNRGILLASFLKDYARAIHDFDKALEINPAFAEAYLGKGTACFLLHNTQEACSNWRRAQQLGSKQANRLLQMHCNR